MAKDFEKGPDGPFPETPAINLGASFGQPAIDTEVKPEPEPKTVTIYKTGGVTEVVPAENIVTG